jgi:hypothetical protein
MKNHLQILALLLIYSCPHPKSCLGDNIGTVDVQPLSPAEQVPFQIVLGGFFTVDVPGLITATTTTNGHTLNITVSYFRPDPGFFEIQPWQTTANIGPLTAGAWRVSSQLVDSNSGQTNHTREDRFIVGQPAIQTVNQADQLPSLDATICTWSGHTGLQYTAQSVSDLLIQNWTDIIGQIDIAGVEGPMSVTNQSTPSSPQFFRVTCELQ